MNPDHLWPLLPALAVVLLHLPDFARDAKRVAVAIVARVWTVGAMWR